MQSFSKNLLFSIFSTTENCGIFPIHQLSFSPDDSETEIMGKGKFQSENQNNKNIILIFFWASYAEIWSENFGFGNAYLYYFREMTLIMRLLITCIVHTYVFFFKLTYLRCGIGLAITNTGTTAMAIYVWLKIQKLLTKNAYWIHVQ